MAEIPHLIQDLALILMVAGLVTLLFKKLRQPLVLGYIVAGFLVSPHMPYLMSVVDKADIRTWADIGVMFLLFSLGLDFSFKKILKMGMAPVIAALTIIFCMMALGTGVGTMFGWSRMNCLFLAGMLAMSSTTIIYKALDDLGLRQQRFAGLVMSVLILEDVLAIVMMVMLSTIARGANPDGSMMIESVGKLLSGRKVLITGSAGSIGSEMVRQIAIYHPAEMMLIDQAETPQHDIRLMMKKDYPDIIAHTVVTSICKQDRMEAIFSEFRPDYVFHAAAYKHVPMMEDNPSESVQNNVWGTKVIADLSVKYGVKKFVMISTDKAVNPTNVMGCSKRICEIYVQSLDKAIKEGKIEGVTQFVTTRFGNVLGSNGSVIPLFRKQLAEGGPLTVTHPKIIRFFMLIPEACKLVLEAGTHGKGGEIFVFDMGEPVRIADLARRMIQLSGAKNVEIQFTGLRDGEKLYEEVLSENENTLPSFHEKIRIAQVRSYEYEDAEREDGKDNPGFCEASLELTLAQRGVGNDADVVRRSDPQAHFLGVVEVLAAVGEDACALDERVESVVLGDFRVRKAVLPAVEVVAHAREVQRRHRVEVARRKTAEATVAEAGVGLVVAQVVTISLDGRIIDS